VVVDALDDIDWKYVERQRWKATEKKETSQRQRENMSGTLGRILGVYILFGWMVLWLVPGSLVRLITMRRAQVLMMVGLLRR